MLDLHQMGTLEEALSISGANLLGETLWGHFLQIPIIELTKLFGGTEAQMQLKKNLNTFVNNTVALKGK